MNIRQLEDKDVIAFRELIINMYSNLENLEWFSPMPYDEENVLGMINHPRFYIIGVFDDDKLVGVSSLDYKCGKLIGKVDFPTECDTTSLVEMAFNMVHSEYRGRGIMKMMINHLLDKITADGFKWAFSKVHKDNFASSKSLEHNGFHVFADSFLLCFGCGHTFTSIIMGLYYLYISGTIYILHIYWVRYLETLPIDISGKI